MKRMFALLLSTLALGAALSAPAEASPPRTLRELPVVQSTVSVRTNHAPTPAPLAPIVISMAMLGAMATTKFVDLRQTYLHEGTSYGPGTDVEVPEDFPDLNEDGSVIHPEGSAAARNAARARSFSTAANTGGVNTGEGARSKAEAGGSTVSGHSKAELEKMTVSDLDALAVELGVPVSRGDGAEGDPLKADYVEALSASK